MVEMKESPWDSMKVIVMDFWMVHQWVILSDIERDNLMVLWMDYLLKLIMDYLLVMLLKKLRCINWRWFHHRQIDFLSADWPIRR